MHNLLEGRTERPDQGLFALCCRSGAYAAAGFAVVAICLSPSFLFTPAFSSSRNLAPVRLPSKSQAKQKREWGQINASLTGGSLIRKERENV